MWRELIVIVWRKNCCWRGLRARVIIAQWEEYIFSLVLSSSRLWSVSEATAEAPSTRDNRQQDRRRDNFVNPINILSAQTIDRLNICFASYTVRGYDHCRCLNVKSNRLKLLAADFHFHSYRVIFKRTVVAGTTLIMFSQVLILWRVSWCLDYEHYFPCAPTVGSSQVDHFNVTQQGFASPTSETCAAAPTRGD